MAVIPELSCFVAAICRSLSEGKDGATYFGSNFGLPMHKAAARNLGLLDNADQLTPKGRAVGEACQHLKAGRSYVYWEEYERCAKAAVDRFESKRERVRL